MSGLEFYQVRYTVPVFGKDGTFQYRSSKVAGVVCSSVEVAVQAVRLAHPEATLVGVNHGGKVDILSHDAPKP